MVKKKDYEELMFKITNPLKRFYSDGKAYLNLGCYHSIYGEKIAGIEGFTRQLWALAPYYSVTKESKDDSFAKIYREGLANATNPSHPEYWGAVEDRTQTLVEMTAIGNALLLAPDTFFKPLDEESKKNLAKWLHTINDHAVFDNNWELFKIIVNIGLKNVGMPYREDVIEDAVAELERWNLGGGWYKDGPRGSCDNYDAFAIHYYSLLYAKSIEKENPERSKKMKERAKQFAKDFIYWYDKDGAGIAFGMSLTYRFAPLAFWSALLWADASPFSYGVLKGIINRNLRYWMESPIFDDAGRLTIGYKYPNIIMSEPYNASGSPYWAMKVFLLLALPEDHPFFAAEEEPLPELEEVHVIPGPKMVTTQSDKGATLYPIGTEKNERTHHYDKFCKFAYSSKYAFSMSRGARTLDMASPDSTLVFKVKDRYYVDHEVTSTEILPDKRLKICWTPVDGIEVETIITPSGSSHKREHTIKAAYPCEAYEAGFAVSFSKGTTETLAEKNKAFVKNADGGCEVCSENGNGIVIEAWPYSNLVATLTKIPAIEYKIPQGETKVGADIKLV